MSLEHSDVLYKHNRLHYVLFRAVCVFKQLLKDSWTAEVCAHMLE